MSTRSQAAAGAAPSSPSLPSHLQGKTPAEMVTITSASMNSACERVVDLVAKKGTPPQAIAALEKIREIQALPTTQVVAETAKILATNDSKRLDLQLKQSTSSTIEQPANTEPVQFKFTFKRKEITEASATVNPVQEFYSATDNSIQITDYYSTALGEVICAETEQDFNKTRDVILNHAVSGKPLTYYFEIHAQVVSAYSIKTGPFKREILATHQLLLDTDGGRKLLDTDKTADFLRLYNPNYFRHTPNIETIEMYSAANADNSSLVSLKIHVSRKTFLAFLHKNRPSIMLYTTPVKIYEQVTVTQCLRCLRFEHTSDTCKNPSRCRFCGAPDKGPNGHYSKNCPKKNSPSCANCIDDHQQKNLDTSNIPSHHATSFKCNILKNQANLVRAKAKKEAASSFTLRF